MAATTNSVQQRSRSVASSLSGELRPAYGLQKLHLGMTREQCRSVIGDPDEVRSFRDGTFFQYLHEGFDVDFELGSKAERLFFYRSGVQRHKNQWDVRYRGITFGASADEIRAALGEPHKTGYVGKKQWMMFNCGIQFDLDSRGRVEIVIVFRH